MQRRVIGLKTGRSKSWPLAHACRTAEVCANCGEAYAAEEVSRQILAAEHAARSGVQVDVREFVGAAT